MTKPISEIHAAMRYVALTREGDDRTPLEGKCRQWLIDDFQGFMKTLAAYDQVMLKAEVAKKAEEGKQKAEGSKQKAEEEEAPDEDEGLSVLKRLRDDRTS